MCQHSLGIFNEQMNGYGQAPSAQWDENALWVGKKIITLRFVTKFMALKGLGKILLKMVMKFLKKFYLNGPEFP